MKANVLYRVVVCQVFFIVSFCVVAQGQIVAGRAESPSGNTTTNNKTPISKPAPQPRPTQSRPVQQSRSQENSETNVDPINSTINNLNTINGTLNEITNTIIGVMGNRANEREAREREAEERERVKEERETTEAEAEAARAAARRRERAPEEESEEDERARERQRAYREQKAREKVAAKVQTSDVCGWKGLQWLGDKDTVPTLEQLRTANGGAVLSGDGGMILKIRTIKDGIITGDINGISVTGTLSANRQIRLAGGDKQSTYYEVWGQFSADGNVLTGKWRNEGYKVDISKPSRGIFALEAECKK